MLDGATLEVLNGDGAVLGATTLTGAVVQTVVPVIWPFTPSPSLPPSISATPSSTASASPRPAPSAAWLAAAAAAPVSTVAGPDAVYSYAYTPFSGVRQLWGGVLPTVLDAGGQYAGFETAADASCPSGVRLSAQVFSGGASSAVCATPHRTRTSTVGWTCAAAGVPPSLTFVDEDPTCAYRLTYAADCSMNPAGAGTTCLLPADVPPPTWTPTTSASRSLASPLATTGGVAAPPPPPPPGPPSSPSQAATAGTVAGTVLAVGIVGALTVLAWRRARSRRTRGGLRRRDFAPPASDSDRTARATGTAPGWA